MKLVNTLILIIMVLFYIIIHSSCGGGSNNSDKPDYSINPDFITPIGIEVVNETILPVNLEEIDYYFRLIENELGVENTEKLSNWYLVIFFLQAEQCGILPNGYECWGIYCGNLSQNNYCGGIYTWYFENYPRITLAWNAPTMILENSALKHELRHHIRHMWNLPGWNVNKDNIYKEIN